MLAGGYYPAASNIHHANCSFDCSGCFLFVPAPPPLMCPAAAFNIPPRYRNSSINGRKGPSPMHHDLLFCLPHAPTHHPPTPCMLRSRLQHTPQVPQQQHQRQGGPAPHAASPPLPPGAFSGATHNSLPLPQEQSQGERHLGVWCDPGVTWCGKVRHLFRGDGVQPCIQVWNDDTWLALY